MKINILSLVLILCFISSVLAQKQQLVFHHITSEQGLSQNHGMCIFQDSQGFMWFGTNDGLNKSNGEKIIVYKNNPEDSTSISNSGIRSIYEDKDKNLWIGTQRGLNLYNRAADNFVKFYLDETKMDYLIYAMCEDKMGNLWLATNIGLYLANIKKKTFKQYLKDISSTCLYCDSSGNLWIGTRADGLFLLDKKSKKFKNYPQERIASILEDQYGHLWISTWGTGLILFDRKMETFTTQYTHSLSNPESISKDIIYATCKDRKGRIWVGTENGGLNLFDPLKGTFEKYVYDIRNKGSISNNSVSAIFEDTIGTLWVGVHRGGINYCNPELEKFQLYQQEPCSIGLNHNNIKAFCEDSDGKIWIATDGGGINVFDPRKKTFSYFRHDPKNPNSVGSDVVLALFRDQQGTMWIGNYLEGLDKYDKKNNRFIHYKHDPKNKNSLSQNNVWNINEDSKGNLWIGTRDGGLNLMDRKNGSFTRFVHEEGNNKSISYDMVTAIFEDRKKNLWIGTQTGLNLLDLRSNNFTRYYNDKKFGGLSNNYILSILEDRAGNLWIGTSNGLNLFDKQTATCKVFNKRNGFPSDVIQSIIEDAHGNLWIGTLEGICKFNYALNTVRNYSASDGLQGNEFIQNAAIKTHDGRMVFGGINGFNIFHPDSVKDNSYKPPIYITGFQLFNRSVGIGKDSLLKKQISEVNEITLSYKQSILSFEFAALNYINPERSQYAYKMDGFDDEWHYIGTQNSTTYTNLNPGKYVFRVNGATNDGVWNETGTSLSIIITPPFWKTWWFKIIACLITLATIYAGHRIKTHKIKTENKRLEARVIERTREIELQKQELANNRDELKQLNLEISNHNEVLEKKVEARTRDLQAINEELAASEEELRQILDQTIDINNKLSESKASLAEAQRIARLGSWELDLLSQQYSWSEETYRIFGKPYGTDMPNYKEVLSKTSIEYQGALNNAIQEAIEYEKPFEIELQINTESNESRWALIIGKPIQNTEGHVGKLIGIIMDNTERKHAQEQLKLQNQELRKINAELDRFVYRASHDLRAPLSSLLGLISITKMEPSDAVKARYYEMMERSINKLDTFIQSIISYSKNSRLEVSVQPIDFQELYDETFENFKYMERSEFMDKKLSILEKTVLYSDPFRLKIIFNNLVSNAIRYSNPAVASYIYIRIIVDEQKAYIEFEDNGRGIAKESIDKVFEMFYRASETNVGSGLGLYIVKDAIQTLGGSINIQSELGKGTTFMLQLPNLH